MTVNTASLSTLYQQLALTKNMPSLMNDQVAERNLQAQNQQAPQLSSQSLSFRVADVLTSGGTLLGALFSQQNNPFQASAQSGTHRRSNQIITLANQVGGPQAPENGDEIPSLDANTPPDVRRAQSNILMGLGLSATSGGGCRSVTLGSGANQTQVNVRLVTQDGEECMLVENPATGVSVQTNFTEDPIACERQIMDLSNAIALASQQPGVDDPVQAAASGQFGQYRYMTCHNTPQTTPTAA
ncbi:MAG: hypothetical protein SFZ03_04565 [Candidatus Melainabacteria bacterium]|nr:hypothetical protein [Candidatus Melainabacteria bacterium]